MLPPGRVFSTGFAIHPEAQVGKDLQSGPAARLQHAAEQVPAQARMPRADPGRVIGETGVALGEQDDLVNAATAQRGGRLRKAWRVADAHAAITMKVKMPAQSEHAVRSKPVAE